MTAGESVKDKFVMLDLGCGKKKRPGTIGVDHSDRHDADVIHDLNVFPYPFESETADKVYMDNVLEHLENPLKVMGEIHRICKKGASVKVIVPYFRSVWAFIDPTHKTFYTVDSFAYYDPDSPISKRYDYVDTQFRVEKVVFNETLVNGRFKRIIVKFANKYPHHYERYFSHFLPLDDISFYITKI